MAPVLALTQGDPAGVGPEILLKLLKAPAEPAPPAADFRHRGGEDAAVNRALDDGARGVGGETGTGHGRAR